MGGGVALMLTELVVKISVVEFILLKFLNFCKRIYYTLDPLEDTLDYTLSTAAIWNGADKYKFVHIDIGYLQWSI